MSMQQLARQIAGIHELGNSTPVLVTSEYLTLRGPLLAALAVELTVVHAKPIRFDWLRGLPSAFSFTADALDRWRANRINCALVAQLRPLGNSGEVQITAAISRPDHGADRWTIGISSIRQPLPNWTTPVFLITSAQEQRDASPERIFHLQSRAPLAAA